MSKLVGVQDVKWNCILLCRYLQGGKYALRRYLCLDGPSHDNVTEGGGARTGAWDDAKVYLVINSN